MSASVSEAATVNPNGSKSFLANVLKHFLLMVNQLSLISKKTEKFCFLTNSFSSPFQ